MENTIPKHLAIIMDGNRRWARENNLTPVSLGHKKGAETLEKITKYCNKIGIKYLTVYAFSTENWKRAKDEVGAIMTILEKYLDRFINSIEPLSVKFRVLGDIETNSLNDSLRNKIIELQEKTKNNTGLQLNVAFNYGGRAEILRATKLIAKKVKNNELDIEDINEEVFSNHLYTAGQDDPDLVIRTSNELRTSNFLPWQITYSELLFVDKYWPDFTEEDVDNAIEIYNNRNRRIGK